MKKQKSDYWVYSPEGVTEVLSPQLRQKDGKIHMAFFACALALYGLVEDAFSYLQGQDKEIVDFRFFQDGWDGGGVISIMISYK